MVISARTADRTALAALAAVIALSPWPLGSRLPWAGMLAASVVLLTAGLWALHAAVLRRPLRYSVVFVPMAAFLLWGFAQWTFAITVYRHATAYELIRYLSYALTMWLALQIASTNAARLSQRVIIGTTIAVSLFGLVQFATWNGRMFWWYTPAFSGTPFGPFNNRNYFAGYLVATIPVGVAALVANRVEARKYLVAAGLWISAFTLLLSRSRGGLLALLAATATVMLLARKHLPEARRSGTKRLSTPRLVALVMITLVVGLALTGQLDGLLARVEALANPDSVRVPTGRLEIWRETLTMVRDRPFTGFGLNTFMWVFPSYRRVPISVIETNAHNEYLEMLAETGLVGALLCASFLALWFRAALSRLRHGLATEFPIRAGAIAAWTGICVFALVDFPTIIPAVDYVLALLGGLALADLDSGSP